jgi:hypothetical protein
VTGSWYSQPFRPDGNITAEGLRNQLGRPALSMPTVLVRESAQNSWDARTSRSVIDFSMELGSVGLGRMTAWKTLLGEGAPIGPPERFPLRQALRAPSIRYLAVSDRGTKGLAGPTRSDVPAPPGERDWLSFVLNSGEARDKEGGGGTYGYGKGVFFLASQVGTVLIYTRIIEEGRLRTRLIGSALCSSYTQQNVPYTGRHWWGLPGEDHCEPLRDADADYVARSLGLPAFDGQDTGTTVVVVEPNLLDPSVPEEEAQQLPAEEAGTFLAEAMAWNLWPLGLPDRTQRLAQSVIADGAPVPVPDERTDAALAHLAGAYRRLRTPQGEDMMCLRPKRLLGRFSHERTMGVRIRSKAAQDLGLVDDLAIGEAPHHVCIMRTPELVVRYIPSRATAHPELGYLGVLRAEDELDPIFAKSEPPTHDAWIDSQLHGAEATYVRVVHRRIRERAEDIAGARRMDVVAENRRVGDVARRLGHLLAGVTAGSGTGGAIAPVGGGRPGPLATAGAGGFSGTYGGEGGSGGGNGRTKGPTGRRGTGRPRLEGSPRFVDVDGTTLVEQQVKLPGPGSYVASVSVVTGDGRLESDPFAGAASPRVLGWRTDDDSLHLGSTLKTDRAGNAVLLVEPVADAALDIAVASSP